MKDKIQKLIEETKRLNPGIANLLDDDLTLRQYSEKINSYHAPKKYQTRQKIVSDAIKDYQTILFTNDEGLLYSNVRDSLVLNIVDHHGILNHPMSFGANIIANYRDLFNKHVVLNVPSTSNISMNDAFHKKGFTFKGIKFNIFSNKDADNLVAFYPKIKFNFVERIDDDVKKKLNDKELSFLSSTQDYFNGLDYHSAKNYSQQVSILVADQWKQLFDAQTRKSLAALRLTPQEDIMSLSFTGHLLNTESFIKDVIVDQDFRNSVLEKFDGIYGAWNKEQQNGTFLFWARRENGEIGRMTIEGDKLIAVDQDALKKEIDLSLASIISALKNNEIYPSLFFIFAFLVFYCGIKPLCGFGSATYLLKMKAAWINILKGKYEEEAETIERIPIGDLIGGPSIAFRRDADGNIKASSAFDVMYSGGLSKDYLDKINEIPFRDLTLSCLPEMNNLLAKQLGRSSSSETPTEQEIFNYVFSWI